MGKIKSVSVNDMFFHLQWLFAASGDTEEDKRTREYSLNTLKEQLSKIEEELKASS